MKTKKLFIIVLLFSMIVIGFFCKRTVFAAEETVNFTIHKQLMEQKPEQAIQNNGGLLEVTGEPLADVGFTIYDVTDAYDELRQSMTQEEALQEIQGQAVTFSNIRITDEQRTNLEGVVFFPNLPAKRGTKNAVYLILETSLPDKQNVSLRTQGVPLVVALPIYALDENNLSTNRVLTDIHLYQKTISVSIEEPKRTTATEPSKPLTSQFPKTGEAKWVVGFLGIFLVGLAVWLWSKQTS